MAIMRRRIEMADRGAAGPSQPYHAAVGLDIREAGQLVRSHAARAAALAETALRGMVADLRQLGAQRLSEASAAASHSASAGTRA